MQRAGERRQWERWIHPSPSEILQGESDGPESGLPPESAGALCTGGTEPSEAGACGVQKEPSAAGLRVGEGEGM